MSEFEPLLTGPEAAKLLHVHPFTMSNWRFARRGPPWVLIEGTVRFEPEALRRYLKDRTQVTRKYAGNSGYSAGIQATA